MAQHDRNGRIVYVIGAGFSKPAGFPLQAEILERVRSFTYLDLADDVPAQASSDNLQTQKFLGERFGSDQEPTLEDVFTLLDQLIAGKVALPGYSVQQLHEVRDVLDRAILLPFHQASASVRDTGAEFYRSVAAFMLRSALSGAPVDGTVSIVSLNWDSLMEDSLVWCVRELAGRDLAGVEYCCPLSSLTGKAWSYGPPSSTSGSGTIKVAKLHGSTNWLSCPMCKRLFTGLGSDQDVWRLYVRPRKCPHCMKLWLDPSVVRGEAPELEPFFVTPTFAKVFDNPHIQLIWHTAFVELSEADEVVFIGYSLPDADYHVRTLLRRAIRRDARITVVLTQGDETRRNTPKNLRRFLPAERYRVFFGSDRPIFELSGVEGYFNRVMGSASLRQRLAGMRRTLRGRRSRQ